MIFATGSNFFGQLGIGLREREHLYVPTPFGCSEDRNLEVESVDDIQCGNQFTVVLSKSGNLSYCGSINGTVAPVLSPIEIPLPIKCVQVACGRKHILALMEKGVVMSWGVGYFGQLGHGDDSSWDAPRMISALDPRRLGTRVIGVVCGGSHSGAVTESNKVFMWGLNRGGQCGSNSKADTLLEPKPIDASEIVPGYKISSFICGRNHSALLTTVGRLYVWGEASYGRIGISDNRKRQASPIELQALKAIPIHSIASGDFHMLALAHDGSVYSWGYSVDGQSGHNSLLNVRVPKRIEFFDRQQIVSIECGASWSVAIAHNGHIFAWGYGDGGWLGIRPPARMAVMESETPGPPSFGHATRDNSASVQFRESASGDHLSVCSFDSRHNVIAPRRVKLLADWRVEKVRCGGAHMIVFCTPQLETEFKSSSEELGEGKFGFPSVGSGNTSVSSSSSGYAESKTSGASSQKPASNSRLDAKKTAPEGSSSSSSSSSGGGVSGSSGNGGVSSAQMISWARNKKITELAAALNAGADVNCCDSLGNTPLIVACQTGHLQVCQLLVQYRVNLNAANHKGNTALHYSFNYGYEDIGNYLISMGADEYATNAEGLTCYEGLTKSDLEYL